MVITPGPRPKPECPQGVMYTGPSQGNWSEKRQWGPPAVCLPKRIGRQIQCRLPLSSFLKTAVQKCLYLGPQYSFSESLTAFLLHHKDAGFLFMFGSAPFRGKCQGKATNCIWSLRRTPLWGSLYLTELLLRLFVRALPSHVCCLPWMW